MMKGRDAVLCYLATLGAIVALAIIPAFRGTTIDLSIMTGLIGLGGGFTGGFVAGRKAGP